MTTHASTDTGSSTKGKSGTATAQPQAELKVPAHATVAERRAFLQSEIDKLPASDTPYVEFPKWKYHTDGDSKVVETAEEEKKLGAGWADSPEEHVTARKGKEK